MGERLVPIGMKLKSIFTPFTSIRLSFELIWRTNRFYTVVYLLLAVFQGIVPMAKLVVAKWIIDAIVEGIKTASLFASLTDGFALRSETYPSVLLLILLEFGLVLLLDALQLLNNLVEAAILMRVTIETDARIMVKSAELDLSYYETSTFFDKLTRGHAFGSRFCLLPLRLGADLIKNVFGFASILGVLGTIHPLMGLVIFVTAIPKIIVDLKYSRQTYQLHRDRVPEGRKANYIEYVRKAHRRQRLTVLSSRRYAKEVKLFQFGDYLLSGWKSLVQRFCEENIRLAWKRKMADLVADAGSNLGYYVYYIFVIYQVLTSKITLGDMVMYTQAFTMLQNYIENALKLISRIDRGHLNLENLFTFLALEPHIKNRDTGVHLFPETIRQGIEFRGVSFTYTNEQAMVLNDLNFFINPGECIAIVGDNGGGKTTLVKLLARLYDATSGEILIDGVSLRDIDLEQLRKNIGVIFQDYVKYEMTADENIGMGNIECMESKKKIEHAARKAGAHNFIKELPLGYQTILSTAYEGGVDLSEGQWQRIALARAFLRDSQILILDEPTASLDALAEHEIFQRFRDLTKGRITVLVSHRFSTVRMADNILVLDRGCIIERGSHEELMALDGKYARMYNTQLQTYGLSSCE